MMGWLMFGWVALGAALLLWALRFPRRLWILPATALMLAGAGYAWQGSPGLPGHPVTAEEETGVVDPEIVALREAMFGRFNFDFSYFMAADAMTRVGAPEAAANVMVGGVRKAPRDAALWTGLGMALTQHDGMIVSPPARYAFEHAIELWPQHPGPHFFYGIALARIGEFAAARKQWGLALENVPEKASYRDAMLNQMLRYDPGLIEAMRAARGDKPE